MSMDEAIYLDTPETAPPVPKTMASIHAAQIRQIRKSHEYQKLREQFRFQEEHRWVGTRMGAECWLCGGEINYALQWPHPYAWELDHAVTVKERPELMLDIGNFRSSHSDCNRQRGSDDPKLDIGVPSEIWAFLLISGFGLVNWLCAWYPAGSVLGQG